MCNFVIRPIKSYATVDLHNQAGLLVNRGDYLEVTHVLDNNVVGKLNGDKQIEVGLRTFVRVFTANPDDIEKVKKQESDWFPKKKDSKESK